ncbi:class F sortase [Streptomyces sp. TRM76323]|uniref:Class F sortase n=1 Tax=Streptomyces tamarix TaxID=3078565 RepID=A0ABU3QUZ7_9ACTN|nr:class F sortase [Streptomyces tamarix]MDT9686167.1 class F sortase [Streptomyces tamarix]
MAVLVSGGLWWVQDGEPSGPAPTVVAAPRQSGTVTASPPTVESKAGQQPGQPVGPPSGPPAGGEAGQRPGQEAGQRSGPGQEGGHQVRPEVPKPSVKPPPAPLGPSPAKRIAVPAITIEASVVRIGLDEAGGLRSPPVDQPRLVGWYEGGVTPGEKGTAILVGHRDTRTGPAIFLNLDSLKPGNTVRVTRQDGVTAVFTVDRVRTYDKAKFPDREVYGPAERPELRLLTCGGTFDPRQGYAANIVVFAHLTDVIPANAPQGA